MEKTIAAYQKALNFWWQRAEALKKELAEERKKRGR